MRSLLCLRASLFLSSPVLKPGAINVLKNWMPAAQFQTMAKNQRFPFTLFSRRLNDSAIHWQFALISIILKKRKKKESKETHTKPSLVSPHCCEGLSDYEHTPRTAGLHAWIRSVELASSLKHRNHKSWWKSFSPKALPIDTIWKWAAQRLGRKLTWWLL